LVKSATGIPRTGASACDSAEAPRAGLVTHTVAEGHTDACFSHAPFHLRALTREVEVEDLGMSVLGNRTEGGSPCAFESLRLKAEAEVEYRMLDRETRIGQT
jgi:hypothetical protein